MNHEEPRRNSTPIEDVGNDMNDAARSAKDDALPLDPQRQQVSNSTQQWYQSYYRKKGADRNDLRANRGVLFQTLAWEASIVRACRAIDHDPANASVLDVGCGCGGDVRELTQLHYDPEKIIGIDLLPERIRAAEKLWPRTRFILGDASRLEFADDSFDLVFESTMFATLPDDVLSAAIAREMVRVCRPGGYLMLVDWWTPKPRDPNYKALTRRRLADLFAVGRQTDVLRICRGALVPPLGRSLSTWLPSVYFLVAAVFPFLVGQVTYVLQKRAETPGR
ncbi:MAG: class I SAM-dependent methyltransferase [Thermoguttaceae bacterium]|jgi:ubiquinone/menaquinone biosynthesis C-methylase UbiE